MEAVMVRYYFDLIDSDGMIVDDEGVELNSLARAQEEAAKSLAEMAREAVGKLKGDSPQEMSIEVRDHSGPVLQIRFTFAVARLRA